MTKHPVAGPTARTVGWRETPAVVDLVQRDVLREMTFDKSERLLGRVHAISHRSRLLYAPWPDGALDHG
jgi:hypothetical protein